MAKASPAANVRVAEEFSLPRLRQMIAAVRGAAGVQSSWTVEQIVAARTAQQQGRFGPAARMVRAMMCDSAVAVARWGRLGPERSIGLKIAPATPKPAAKRIAEEAEASYGKRGAKLSPETRASIDACLVDHGVAFAYCVDTQREDGSRIDKEVHYWPIDHVEWDDLAQTYVTQVDSSTPVPAGEVPADYASRFGGWRVPIVHGDGRWVIFRRSEHLPHATDATCVPAALEWASHAFALADWRRGSKSHGNAKIIGKMPDGQPLQEENSDTPTPEAAAFMDLLVAIWNSDLPVGIAPFGADVEVVANNSTAWQVWDKLADLSWKALARIYCGTDATLGSAGGAPGVDIAALFGVLVTLVEGDLRAIERGIQTGVIEPWCAVNFGDSSLAPTWRYDIPDADEKAQREEDARLAEEREKRRAAFFAAIKSTRDGGFVVDQPYVDKLAEVHGVEEVPQLPPPTAATKPTAELPPTGIVEWLTPNEIRSQAGVGAAQTVLGSPDPRGNTMTHDIAASEKAALASASQPAPQVPPVP